MVCISQPQKKRGGDRRDDICSKLGGIKGINAPLANAEPCSQQDNADAMIDFANSPGPSHKDDLITKVEAFAGHPLSSLGLAGGVVHSTPLCT